MSTLRRLEVDEGRTLVIPHVAMVFVTKPYHWAASMNYPGSGWTVSVVLSGGTEKIAKAWPENDGTAEEVEHRDALDGIEARKLYEKILKMIEVDH